MTDKHKFNLTTIYFNASQRCNLFCKHCWQSSPVVRDVQEYTAKVKNEIRLAELKPAIEEALALGLRRIKMTGGEPFLRPDILDFVEYFSQRGLQVAFETNGTLVTEKTVKSLKKFGVSHVSVSIDSSLQREHDAFRGMSGAFQKAVRTLKLLIEYGIPTQIIFSVYRKNLSQLWEAIALAQKIKVNSFKINHICSIGRGLDLRRTGQALSVREVLKLKNKIERKSLSVRRPAIFLDVPIAFRAAQFIQQNYTRGAIAQCDVLHLLGILADGSVSMCGIGSQEKALVMGNIRDESLKKIWEESAILKCLRRQVPFQFEGICKKCIMQYTCLGSCRAEVYALKKSFTKSYSFCAEAYREGLFPENRIM